MVGDINCIVIIESLANERLTGAELYQDCIQRNATKFGERISHRFHSVSSKDSLIEILKYYQVNSVYMPVGLLMHFEMHGNSNMEGLVLSDQSHIEWKELSDLFRPINISTANNLFISMATCYGRYLYKGVDQYKKSPYSGYISASKAVYPYEIIDKFSILFERLLMFGNVVDAYIEMEKEGSDFYYKDSERAFEDSYQMMIDEINESPAKKKELIEEGRTILKQMGLTPPSEKEHEFIFDLVLKNIYKEQKAAFEF